MPVMTVHFCGCNGSKGLNAEQQQAALAKYKALQEEDMKLLESDRTLFDWCSKQTYIALANMLTGAAALGIDSAQLKVFITIK